MGLLIKFHCLQHSPRALYPRCLVRLPLTQPLSSRFSCSPGLRRLTLIFLGLGTNLEHPSWSLFTHLTSPVWFAAKLFLPLARANPSP